MDGQTQLCIMLCNNVVQ